MKLTPIFENSDWMAFSKPSGLLTIPDRFRSEIPNLITIAREKYGQLFVVHRLDKDTSGIVCFAKNATAHRYLSKAFETRRVSKFYRAIVLGTPNATKDSVNQRIAPNRSKKGLMQISATGKEARTDYEVLKSWRHFSLLNLQIFTGRTHQIRVHLQHIGHSVVCDTFYGDGQPFLLSEIKSNYRLSKDTLEERPILHRLALHAHQLIFQTENNEEINIQSPLPKDMRAMINQLDKWDAQPD